MKDVLDGIATEDNQDMRVSWAAFHASRVLHPKASPTDITVLLPLFQEEAKSVSMILYSLNVINKSVQF